MPDGLIHCKTSNTRFGTDIFSIYRASIAGVRGYDGFYRSGWNTPPWMLYAHETTFFARRLSAFGTTRQKTQTCCKNTSSRQRTSPHLLTALGPVAEAGSGRQLAQAL